jgi:hypothetical protein
MLALNGLKRITLHTVSEFLSHLQVLLISLPSIEAQMFTRLLVVTVLICGSLALHAQAAPEVRDLRDTSRYQLYGGYTWLSNSFNGLPGHRQALSGWDASLATQHLWRGLRFKVETAQFRGTNYGAPQHAYFILGGWQYDFRFKRETLFGHVMVGDIGINQNWGPNQHAGMTASFATLTGGGLDTPIGRRFAIRAGGDWVYENFALVQSAAFPYPYRIPGLPNYMGRVTAGVVWKF